MNRILYTLIWLACVPMSTWAQAPKKIALLVGVERYDKVGFTELNYSEDDVEQLRSELQICGFRVVAFKGSNEGKLSATKKNIETYLNEEFLPGIGNLKANDIVLIYFAGHGMQKATPNGEGLYFAPRDAHQEREETWVSIGELMDRVGKESACKYNLFLVDACRVNGAARGIDGKGFFLRKANVSAFLACDFGQVAVEDRALGAGVFTHSIVEGLSGLEKDRAGNVNWWTLTSYVQTEVSKRSGGKQLPHILGSVIAPPPILRSFALKPPQPEIDDEKPPLPPPAQGKPARHDKGLYLIPPLRGMEWKVFNMNSEAVDQLTEKFEGVGSVGGSIKNQQAWSKFWTYMNADQALPNVDFNKSMVIVETIRSPRWINTKALSSGRNDLKIQRDFSEDKVEEKPDQLNAHVYVIDYKYISSRLPMRFGVTAREAIDGIGMEITHVVDGLPGSAGRVANDPSFYTLEKGDVILSVNGQETNSHAEFAAAVKNSPKQMTATVRNVQDGTVGEIMFELDE